MGRRRVQRASASRKNRSQINASLQGPQRPSFRVRKWFFVLAALAGIAFVLVLYPSGTNSFALAPDVIVPSPINTLAAGSPTSETITLMWTATGDDGASGQAAQYDLRFSYASISEGNWASAEAITTNLTPKTAGQAETYTVSGLMPDVTYYFAIKVIDEAANSSTISNVVQTTTSTIAQFRSPYTNYSGKNLFLDGGFETGEDHFNLMRMMAAEDYPGGAIDYREVVFDTTPGNVMQGATSLKFDNGNVGVPGSSKNDYALLEFNWLKLADSTNYTLSFWAKAANFGSASYHIVANLKDVDGNAISTCPSAGFDLTTSWQRFSMPCATSTGVPEQMYNFYFTSGANSFSVPRSTANAKGTVWLDGIQLEQGATATGYENPFGLAIGIDGNSEEPMYFTQDLSAGGQIILTAKLFYDTAANTNKNFVLRYYLKNNYDEIIATAADTVTLLDGAVVTHSINISQLLSSQAPSYVLKKGMYKFFLYAMEEGNDPGPIINREEFVYGVAERNTSGPNPDSPFGTHFEIGSMVGGLGHGAIIGSNLENHFELAEAMGFKHLRDFTLARWEGAQREEDDTIAWWDTFVDLADEHGLELMPILNMFTPPDWATAQGANGEEIRSNPFAIWFDWRYRLADPEKVKTFVAAVVNHYKADIKQWEVVNEPAFAMLPREYYDHYLEPSYEAAKAADPTATLIGPDPGAGSGWGYFDMNFIQKLAALDGGGFNHLDRVSFHMYDNMGTAPENPPSIFSLPYADHRKWQTAQIREIDADIPIDDTESGFQEPTLYSTKSFHGDGGNQVGGAVLGGDFVDTYSGSFSNSIRVAQYRARLNLLKLATNVGRIDNFSLRAQQSIAAMGGLTLTHYDGEPTTSLISLGALMNLFAAVDFSSVVELPYDRLKTVDAPSRDTGNMSYLFRRNDDKGILTLWNWKEDSARAPEETFVNVSMNIDVNKITAYDFLGNEVSLASNGQSGVVIPVGNSPIFIVSTGSSGSYTYNQFLPLVQSATSLTGLPPTPSALQGVPGGTPQTPVVQLNWQAPADTSGIVGYNIYRVYNFSSAVNVKLNSIPIAKTVTTYIDTLPTLVNNTVPPTNYKSEIFSYRYWVVSVDGSDRESHKAYEIVPDAWHSNVPASLTTGTINNSSATLSWQAGAAGNDTYQFLLYQNGEEVGRVRYVPGQSAYSYTYNYLTSGTPYTFEVSSIDNLHNESTSVSQTVTTTGQAPVVPDVTPPSTINDLIAS